jgi:predicted dithiol-disulfide oxidoreductase (DUF899 family)
MAHKLRYALPLRTAAAPSELGFRSARDVVREEWIRERMPHLAREKEFTWLRDQLSRERRELPWGKVEKPYVFDGPSGRDSFSDLFQGRSQLIVYHFMFGPSWDEGGKSRSFWMDNFDGNDMHLNHRDVSLVLVSRAPFAALEAYRTCMGWRVKWVSSEHTDFNRDSHVSFTRDELESGQAYYNDRNGSFPAGEAPGLSEFYTVADGAIYHAYSCYARGLDMLNTAYHLLDLVPKGRDEAGLPHSMTWLRHHDRSEDRPLIPLGGLRGDRRELLSLHTQPRELLRGGRDLRLRLRRRDAALRHPRARILRRAHHRDHLWCGRLRVHPGYGARAVGRRLAVRRVRQLLLAVHRLVRHRPRGRGHRVHVPPAPPASGHAAESECGPLSVRQRHSPAPLLLDPLTER